MNQLQQVAGQVVVCHGLLQTAHRELAHFEVGVSAVEELERHLVRERRPLLQKCVQLPQRMETCNNNRLRVLKQQINSNLGDVLPAVPLDSHEQLGQRVGHGQTRLAQSPQQLLLLLRHFRKHITRANLQHLLRL